jgi:hypothetical protein
MEVPVSSAKNRLSGLIRRALIAEIREGTRGHAHPGPNAARSQEFLYDDDDLPA